MKTKKQGSSPDESVAEAIKMMNEHPGLAEALLKQTLKHHPDHKPALEVCGVIQHHLGKNDESAKNFERLTELDPDYPDNWSNLGTAYGGLGLHDKAIEVMEKSVRMDPKQPLYRNNLAIQYRAADRHEEAVKQLKAAIDMGPSAQMWDNLGGVYSEMANYEEAIKCHQKAVMMNSKFIPAQINLSLAYHFSGDWQKGFQQYEWRFFYYESLRDYLNVYDVRKMWDGKADLTGKTVLVFGEQGFGDIIMFSRFLKDVKSRGAHVIFHVPEELKEFMKGVSGIDEMFVHDMKTPVKLPDHDYHFALMSAPYLLGKQEISGMPYASFYLNDFNNWLNEQTDDFKIGVVWSGNPENPDDKERSIPVEYFQRLDKIPGVRLFSLQFGGAESGFPDITPFIKDFSDTARIIQSFDLVICCDTAIAHVAGSVGVPVWDLIRFGPDWRWPKKESTTHWYDSMGCSKNHPVI
jgi:tetratricopeptide (TPR) repeat protein